MVFRKRYLVLVMSFVSLSCNKEGCTDALAENYDNRAKIDDASCVYEANLVFWFDSDTETIMMSSGVTSLSYFLDGTLIGNYSAATGFSSAPSCENENVFRKSIAYDVSSSKILTYRVEDQSGNQHFSGSVTAVAKSCTPVQLIY